MPEILFYSLEQKEKQITLEILAFKTYFVFDQLSQKIFP